MMKVTEEVYISVQMPKLLLLLQTNAKKHHLL